MKFDLGSLGKVFMALCIVMGLYFQYVFMGLYCLQKSCFNISWEELEPHR